MARVDIVVFPNGGREIFGQMAGAKPAFVSAAIDAYLETLEASSKPRKFTGYYDAPDASDIEWMSYDENNPIVMVEKEQELPADDDEEHDYPRGTLYEPMELAQIPEAQKEKYRLDI